MTTYTDTCTSPIGELRVAVDDRGRLCALDLPGGKTTHTHTDAVASRRHCAHVVRQLREYFAGKRTAFELDLAPEGTEFQQRAWRALRRIPFGRTASYQ